MRELERKIEKMDLHGRRDSHGPIVWADPESGEWFESPGLEGEPLDPDDVDPLLVWEEAVVMDRDRAKSEGYEILGPAKDVPNDRDVVRVRWDR